MSTGSPPDGIRSELSMEFVLLGPCPGRSSGAGALFDCAESYLSGPTRAHSRDLAPEPSAHHASSLRDLPFDVDGLAAPELVDDVRVGVEDRRGLVTQLLGDLRDRQPLL